MSRRNVRRGNATALSPLLGLGSLTSARYLACAGALDGVGAGFYVTLVMRPSALGANNSYWAKLGGADGWGLLMPDATTLVFRAANGVGTLVSSPAYTLTGLETKTLVVCGVHTGTHLRLYVQGVEVGAGTAITGYTPLAGTAYLAGGGSASPYLDWFGCGGGNGVPTAQNVADWHALVRSTRRVQDMPGVPGAVYAPTPTGAAPSGLTLGGTGHVLLAERYPAWG